MIFDENTSGLVTIFTKLGNYVCKEGDSYACNALIKHQIWVGMDMVRGESDVAGFGERVKKE